MRKTGKRFKRNTCTINPLFALSTAARNMLATTERVAIDALLAHTATADHVGEVETLIEASIRAIGIAQREGHGHLDADALGAAVQVFHRAAWAIRRAKERHEATGVYGLDGPGRLAVIQADELVAEMRKPGVLLRKTWLIAFKEAYAGKGVELPEECPA